MGGTATWTLKPMTSDAVDDVDVDDGTEKIVFSEAMDSHSTLREAAPRQTTGE